MRWFEVFTGGLAAGLTSLAVAGGADAPPAPARGAVDTMYGVRVDDPYRGLERLRDPAVRAWMQAQSAQAHAVLQRIPGREALLQHMRLADAAAPPPVEQVSRTAGGRVFALRRDNDDQAWRLTVREGLAGVDRVLVDPARLERRSGRALLLAWYRASPDGRRVAYGLARAGADAVALRVLDVDTGQHLGPAIDRADLGLVDWSPDGQWLLFNRLRRPHPGMLPTERDQRSVVLAWRPGTPLADAIAVFASGAPGAGVWPADIPSVSLSADGRWAVGVTARAGRDEIGLFLADQQAMLQGRAVWHRVLDPTDGVTAFALHGGRLSLLRHRSGERGEVVELALDAPGGGAGPSAAGDPVSLGRRAPSLREARTVLPPSTRVLTGLVAAADALYVAQRDGNLKRLLRRAHSAPPDAPFERVPLPHDGSLELTGAAGEPPAGVPDLPGLLLSLQGWTQARRLWLVPADGPVVDSGLQAVPPPAALPTVGELTATELTVRSHDGAEVPMSVIHRRDLPLDGNRPTLLYGYGSYGMTDEPYFSVSRLAWLAAGGVYAVINPRGSGVLGDGWHLAGFQGSKPNTWLDAIAAAEALVQRGYTRPARLGLVAGSAGAILAGRAVTARPDLFAAAVIAAGSLDMLRQETTPNGVVNIAEFGSVRTEAGFRALLAMSTYAAVRPGTAYPGLLFSHGEADALVPVWQSSKTAARFQAATTSGRPVLLRLDPQAGHGAARTRDQVFQERADWFSFLLWQMGEPDFQPLWAAGSR